MSVFKKLSKTDRAILGGSVAILLILSYLLYDDSLLFRTSHRDEKPIGSILKTQNDVRRKGSDNFVWFPGNNKDQVYNRDSIFTGDQSQAVITLNDGSLIQIQENSLVNLNMINGQMQLDLRFGQFSGNGTTLKFKSCGQDYTLDGSNAKFEIDRSLNCDLNVKVLSGDVQLKTNKGNQSIKSNETLKISKSGAEKADTKASISLLTQEDAYQFRTHDKQPVYFAWKGEGPLAQYQIEISKMPDFRKVLSTKSTHAEKVGIKDSLKEGPYFWRVKGLDSQRKVIATSKPSRFYLSYMPAPIIQTPLGGAKINAKIIASTAGAKAPIKVSWTGDNRLVSYEMQVSKTPEFDAIIETKNIKTKEVETQNLVTGAYYTRVRGFDKDNRPSPWSKQSNFSVDISAEQKPPAPRLVEKRIRFQIPPGENRTPSSAKAPRMAWTDVDEAKDYRWEIANNAQFTGAQVVDTPDTSIAWKTYKPGNYYYRVFSRTELGQMSNPSETGVLEVFGLSPVLEPIPTVVVRETNFDAVPPTKDAHVKWTPLAEAKSYLVQVDKDADFKNPALFEFTDIQGSVPLSEPGRYFVRVKGLNETRGDVSDFSNVQDVNYIFRVTLKAPELIEPYDKTTVFLQKDMEPLIWLEWRPVPDADRYIVEVATDSDYAKIVASKEMKQTRFLIQQKVPYGPIYWRVRALGKDAQMSSDWSERQFTLYHERNRGF